MARRSRSSGSLDGLGALAALALLGLMWQMVASAWQSWVGRIVLVLAVAILSWLTVLVFARGRRRRRIHAQTLDELLALDPSQFEHAVAQLLADEGCRSVRVHGGAGDLQADVTARAPDGTSVVVQCKRFRPGNKVGSPVVQSFIGMAAVHHGAGRGMIVTTSTFTGPAAALATRHGIELVDGDALVQRIARVRQAAGRAAAAASVDGPPPSPPPLPGMWTARDQAPPRA